MEALQENAKYVVAFNLHHKICLPNLSHPMRLVPRLATTIFLATMFKSNSNVS